MRRLTEATGLIPVEYPTTRQLGASAEARAADVTAAFAEVKRWVRALGERGVLESIAGVLVARPPVSELGSPVPSARERSDLRAAQRDIVIDQIGRYNSDAVVCVGVPFGHTRPQWIVPHGGTFTLDGGTRTVVADY